MQYSTCTVYYLFFNKINKLVEIFSMLCISMSLFEVEELWQTFTFASKQMPAIQRSGCNGRELDLMAERWM